MKILYVAGESLPFASSGGLGDVIGSLPAALAKADLETDVRVIMPLYSAIGREWREKFTFLKAITVKLAWRSQYCGIFSFVYRGVTFYFIDNEYYFARPRLYGEFDDGERFAFFCRAALEILPEVEFFPDILHAHDWHAALSVIYLKQYYSRHDPRYSGIKAVMTIHNIQYQGIYGFAILGDVFGLMPSDSEIVEYDGDINLLKGGIVCADRVTTVSPTYSLEIRSPRFSHGLDGVLDRFYFKLSGILNGIDTDYYNPSKDKEIAANYSWRSPAGKAECKAALQRELGLPEKDVPLVAVISRLVGHKGLDLVMLAGEELMKRELQLVVLGKGEQGYENYFGSLAYRYGNKCRALITYDRALSKRIYSASDLFLMPSRSEPCGLAQMIASRYGSVPVIHETGGLYDSIKDVGSPGGGNGFTFAAYSSYELLHSVDRGLKMYYEDREFFEKLRKKVMRVDFSWKKSALEYIALYNTLVK
ncbi:MAG: glycogen synthase [Clostridia bacterium]|nr:glycogen synthase [Clostridia bacterium]